MIRRQAKSIPIKDKEGIYYRCWYCGWTCDKTRDSVDGDSKDNQIYFNENPIGARASVSDFSDGKIILGGHLHRQSLMELGSDGNPKVIRYNQRSDVSGGCPLCGTANWKADHS